MGTNPNMSRRDWFLLRGPQPSGAQLGPDAQPGLRPIDEPPNPDGLDLSQLPPVHEAILTADDVRNLLADIERYAEQVQIMTRQAAVDKAEQKAYLRVLRDKLLNNEVAKVQVRYSWQGVRWIDTLEQKPAGIRLVRIGHGQA